MEAISLVSCVSMKRSTPCQARDLYTPPWCNGRTEWPAKGVYFFFEEGEARTTSGTAPGLSESGPTL